MEDLKEKGLLDSTVIVWMGEFAAPRRSTALGGRDTGPFVEYGPGGRGIKGGQVVARPVPTAWK